MREVTIRDTKARLTHWVRMAEKGASLRLTRRGKPVAVLMSEREYERLKAAGTPRRDFLRFLQGWRREMIAKGLPLATDAEIEAMRDRRPARDFSFGK
jgi:prevent-host-death family protein